MHLDTKCSTENFLRIQIENCFSWAGQNELIFLKIELNKHNIFKMSYFVKYKFIFKMS